MGRNMEMGIDFEKQIKKTKADNLEVGDVVHRDTPLRGRRPSNEDLEDPIIAKQRHKDMLSDNTLEIGNAIPANNDTLEMGNVDDTEVDIKDDKLEIGNAIKTENTEDTIEIGPANADILETEDPNNILEMDEPNETLEMGNSKKIGIIEKFKNYLKEKLNI